VLIAEKGFSVEEADKRSVKRLKRGEDDDEGGAITISFTVSTMPRADAAAALFADK
jgi:hypothetical protein